MQRLNLVSFLPDFCDYVLFCYPFRSAFNKLNREYAGECTEGTYQDDGYG